MQDNIETVALAKAPDYSLDVLGPALDGLLGCLGGVAAFIRPGQKVLIKPNLLTDRSPPEAVTTHPEVVRALIRVVRQHGAQPQVGDSPASAARVATVWKKTGFEAMCAEEDVPLINLQEGGSIPYDVEGFRFNIAKTVLEADVVVNVPKLKTHVFTTLTAAVKNMYGCVPGFQKTTLHKLYPTPTEFGGLMARIFRAAPQHLNVVDGILAMDGDGPSGGRPHALGFLAAARDAVALDVALCRILGIRVNSVPYLTHLLPEKGEDQPEIELVGADPDELSPASFKLPSTFRTRLLPRGLIRLLGPLLWIRPAITDACLACGRCVRACPSEALSLDGKPKPVLTPEKCIGCCCCHEVCPERAITMRQSPLLDFFRRGKLP
ncbi:DUF362 domain-containing protein [Verrucomicrobiota bacterium]